MNFSKIETDILLQNNSPVDDFLGLSPNDMHNLIHETFQTNSIVRLRSDIDESTIDRVPFFRIAEELLKIIQREGSIKLTPLGALPKKFIVELYSHKFITEEFIENGITKLSREKDSISIETAKIVLELARLTRKVKGKLSLTKKATILLTKENRISLLKVIFETFATKFSWSYNDLYPEEPIGQLGWAYTVFMLNKFGSNKQSVAFYAEKYLIAFPYLLSFFIEDYYSDRKESFIKCYEVRTFDRFFMWLGIVKVEGRKTFLDQGSYTTTDLFKQLFSIEED